MNLCEKVCFSPNNKKKQSPHRTLRLQEVEIPRIFGQSAHNGGKVVSRGQLKCDGTRAEIKFHLSAKRTSPFKSAGGGASVQSTTGSRGVRISGTNAGYTMFRDSVKGRGYPLHSPVSHSLPQPCVTVCHHISTGVYY